jgi:preprotein translocase subunit SecE
VEEVLPTLRQAGAAQGIEVTVATEVMPGASGGVRGFVIRVFTFLRDAQAETKRVTWPSWEELRKATIAIILFTTALGVIIGLMDSLFQFLLVTVVAKMF